MPSTPVAERYALASQIKALPPNEASAMLERTQPQEAIEAIRAEMVKRRGDNGTAPGDTAEAPAEPAGTLTGPPAAG